MTIVQCPNCKVNLTSNDMPFKKRCPYCGKEFPQREKAIIARAYGWVEKNSPAGKEKMQKIMAFKADIVILNEGLRKVMDAYSYLKAMPTSLSKPTKVVINQQNKNFTNGEDLVNWLMLIGQVLESSKIEVEEGVRGSQ